MNVVLHGLSRDDDGIIRLDMSCGGGPQRAFLATYDGADPMYKCCSMDEELFMLLSDLAHQRYGNCVVYQGELMCIISAFAVGEELPDLPATLETTTFCTLKPGAMRIMWNKLLILMRRMGFA
jgi:hypothetical protein